MGLRKWEPVDWKDYWGIPLTKGEYTIISKESFHLIKDYAWRIVRGYAATMICGKNILMHRIIMGVLSEDSEVDHINFIKLDNRLENLRVCTRQENTCNQKISTRNTSGFRGVTWNKHHKKWHAQIKYKGVHKHLGYYNTPDEASIAYENKAKELFGLFYNPIA